jgi:hypothetical protein
MGFSESMASSTRASILGFGLIANAFANAISLFQQVVEEIPNIVRDAVDHREDLLEHISNQVRGRNSKVIRKFSDVVGELLGDASVDHPLLAGSMPMATGTTRARPTARI